MLNRLRFLPFLCLSAVGVAHADCRPNGELEKVYCQLQAKGESLPKMSDFRRNDARMQQLLLKRPAAKHGIRLPVVDKKSAVKATSPKRAAAKPKPKKVTKPAVPLAVVEAKAAYRAPSRSALGRALQTTCSISEARISCAERHYQLLDNLNNRHLNKQVFAESNRLGLSNYLGSINHKPSLNDYMGDAYQRYIEGMLKIGLGASTMTYSKFYYTFEDAWNNKRDFADRFEQMYVFLKKDKQSMGVKKRYSNDLPAGLHQCAELSSHIIVCDNKKINWVYYRH